jgi:hypothetical protein
MPLRQHQLKHQQCPWQTQISICLTERPAYVSIEAPSQVIKYLARILIRYFLRIIQCAALKLAFPDKVSYFGSTAYNGSVSSYWSVQEESVRPTCVITPTTSRDVALAVSLLNVGGVVLPGKCEFAVRSGG